MIGGSNEINKFLNKDNINISDSKIIKNLKELRERANKQIIKIKYMI